MRHTLSVLLFLALAATGLLMLHEGMPGPSSSENAALNLGYQHSQRLQVAAARAAVDALGMSTSQDASYQSDYRLQRMQIQADSEGLDRWAAHDIQRQGLLLEIRASLAALRTALEQTTGANVPSPGTAHIPLLPALVRSENALSNYSASLAQPEPRTGNAPANPERSGLMLLFLVELAALAWLFFSNFSRSKRNVSPL